MAQEVFSSNIFALSYRQFDIFEDYFIVKV